MKRYFVLWCVCMSCAATAAAPKLRLPVGHEVYTLNSFHRGQNEKFYGVYCSPYDYTSGTFLHLFPNGRFVIVNFSDVGPDQAQANGNYEVQGDLLTFHFLKVRSGQEDLRRRFAHLHLLWGWIEEKDSVTGFEVFIFSHKEWQKLNNSRNKPNYLRRRIEYHDWEAVLRSYSTQI